MFHSSVTQNNDIDHVTSDTRLFRFFLVKCFVQAGNGTVQAGNGTTEEEESMQ